MRKGFRSSRGAILGTMGGAAGFTTVAIGVGPLFFWWSARYKLELPTAFAAFLLPFGPYRKTKPVASSARRSPHHAGLVLGSALVGTEMQNFAVHRKRQCQFLGQVHTAYRVLHQPLAATDWFRIHTTRFCRTRICSANGPAQQLHRPGNQQNPKQEPYDPSEK